jgi:hypothetical protein
LVSRRLFRVLGVVFWGMSGDVSTNRLGECEKGSWDVGNDLCSSIKGHFSFAEDLCRLAKNLFLAVNSRCP